MKEKRENIGNSFLTVSKEPLKSEHKKHKSLMTEEILQLMDGREKLKSEINSSIKELIEKLNREL